MSNHDSTMQGGLGHIFCPLDPKHKISYAYRLGLHRSCLLEAVRDHLEDCPSMKQLVAADHPPVIHV